MLGTIKTSVVAVAVAITTMSVPLWGAQQSETGKAKQVTTAPVPAPIITGKKMFISNAGGDSDISPDHYSGGPDRAYNQFYAAMKSWGRYELVSAPSDADLIFELHFTAPMGTTRQGYSSQDPRFTLVIKDRATQVVLWSFIERLPQIGMTHDRSFDQAMAKLVDNVRNLVDPHVSTTDAGAK